MARSLSTLLVATALLALPATAGAEAVVEGGKQVSLEYTLTLEDGSTVDSNVGKSPLVFVVGSGRLLPGLESQLLGLKLHESKHVELGPEQGYGPVNEQAFSRVEASQVPEDARVVGTVLIAQDGQGRRIPVRVHEVGEEQITLDYNHPLAGKTLAFDVKVVGIEDAPAADPAAEATGEETAEEPEAP